MNEYYHKGKLINLNDLTFKEYSELFVREYCVENVSKVTLKSYKQILSKILPYLGNQRLCNINALMLDTLYNKLKYGEKTKVRKPETRLHYYRLLNKMFEQAVKWNLLESNPNINATKPKKERNNIKGYDFEDVKALLECLKNESIRDRLLITLALDSSCRRSEIVALRWSDVDFEKHSIKISKSLKVVEGIVDEQTTKTTASKREIIISKNCIDLLLEYKEWQQNYKGKLGNKWVEEDRIFTSRTGTHMHPDTCGKIFNKIQKKI